MKKYKTVYTAIITMILLIHYITTPVLAATTIGHYTSAISSSNYYQENAPINRVFYVKTGSSAASRTLKFNQIAGAIEYYMFSPTTKSCMQKYKILVFDEAAKKVEKTHHWNWSKSKTIKLNKENHNYMIIVYPEDFDVVKNKYLSTKILKLKPIIYGYKDSPYFTITTSASIRYSESDSLKIAPF